MLFLCGSCSEEESEEVAEYQAATKNSYSTYTKDNDGQEQHYI